MGLSNKLSCKAGSFSCCLNPYRFFQSEVFRLYFPALGPWVARSVSLPSCSSQFICMQMWGHPVHNPPPHWVLQPLPCCESSCESSTSLPLLPFWMNVSFLTPWLSDFHTVQFSGSSGYFLFLNWLSFFWLCDRKQRRIYLCLHGGWKSSKSFLK